MHFFDKKSAFFCILWVYTASFWQLVAVLLHRLRKKTSNLYSFFNKTT